MHLMKCLSYAIVLVLVASEASAQTGRQYYGDWEFHPNRGYYTRKYFYQPITTVVEYRYHYCVYYPSQPRYFYFYNPVRRVYWGRFDTEGKKGEEYSLLEEKDRKGRLADINESAFPKPSAMPAIPESKGGTPMQAPPLDRPSTDAVQNPK